MIPKVCKRLAEVDFPITVVSKQPAPPIYWEVDAVEQPMGVRDPSAGYGDTP